LDPDFVPQLRWLTRHYGVLLILDEVITGFRVGPGGFQGESGVIPDLTSLAKILAGGLPGGAVAGRADILDLLAFKDDPEWNKRRKFRHQGTFNANPVSAAAGTTALRIVAEGWATRYVNELAALLRAEMNQVIASHHLTGCVYGTYSMFHILPYNPHNPYEQLDPSNLPRPFLALRDANPVLYGKLRRGLQVHGVDLMSDGGMLSIAHTEADVRQAAQALDNTLGLLKAEGAIPGV